MALVINNNSMATTAQNNLTGHYNNLATSTERLSSGLRINSAADDAAGLAIREMMRSDIATFGQGIRNANDAISMVQTADGALGVIDEKLIRMKELAEQASTGTYTTTQRDIISSEYVTMASEITRISEATDFNGISLLDGSRSGDYNGTLDTGSEGAIQVHFGKSNDETKDYYDVVIGHVSAEALGVEAGFTTQDGAKAALALVDAAITSKDKIRANLGGLQNRLEATVDNITIQKENLQASESRVSDVDVASEMTTFVKNQILTNSAVSMLGQANNMPQMALQLIG